MAELKLNLYNTLTRQKEEFTPIDPQNVRMYCCGPTVYSYAHVGNGRAAVVFDVLYRLLRHTYGADKVKYVRNITDIDDKIIASSQKTGEDISSITARYEQIYLEDMATIGCLQPDIMPRATEHMGQMIAMIETLVAKGHAYAAEGHVLFDVASMKDYGRLSRKNQDELVAGARVEVAPYKRSPTDFVLWKPAKEGEPGWESPWGRGRPGWHIECSAMSETHLGETFDIHAGGLDLIFPHHENEIAQSCCAHDGKPMANYWLHNGFLNMGEEKMSKSLGNVVCVHDLLKKWQGEVIRLALLSAHYRQPLGFTDDLLQQCKNSLDSGYRMLADVQDISPVQGDEYKEDVAGHLAALADDMNTPSAFRELVKCLDLLAIQQREGRAAPELKALFEKQAEILGLFQQTPDAWFAWQPEGAKVSEEEIRQKIDARTAAKKAKNFAEADRLRDELQAQGIALEDSPEGTKWRYAG